ncbi:hypothetical protein D3C86_2203200 [compost metagenome]
MAINRVIGERLTSGRNTTRSTATANSTIAARLMTKASQNGTPRSSRLTNVSAENSTMAPWAKLKTPDAL